MTNKTKIKMRGIYFLLITFITLCNILSAQTYHEDDKEGLRKFLRQTEIDKEGNIVKNFQNLGLTTQDTLNWQTSEDWVSKVIGLTWDNSQFKRIKKISWLRKDLHGRLNCSLFEILINLQCDSNQLTSIDISNNVNLKDLSISNNQLTSINLYKNVNLRNFSCELNLLSSIDVSKNVNLEFLAFGNNQLTSIDVSKNVNLKTLNLRRNQLTSIDVSKNVNLEFFQCGINKLTDLDISKNVNLKTLRCDSNKLASIDVSKNVNLEFLDFGNNQLSILEVSKNKNLERLECADNSLTSLDLSNNIKLEDLNCESNYLKFSSLPLLILRDYKYFPQKKIIGGEVNADQLIDLSGEYTIDGNNTTYTWYKSENEEIKLVSTGNGKFIAPVKYIGDTLLCKMTNKRFPELTLEYKILIKEQRLNVVQDHLQIKTSLANKHEVIPGEKFKVDSKSTLPENVKIGLFSTVDNISLISRVDISRNEYTYTCAIPQEVRAANYVLQPYIENNGEIEIIERSENSVIIDKLPLTVKQGDFKVSKEVLKNIQIKTSEQNLYQVEVEEKFQINVPSEKEVKIGLFDINGIFVEDVTVSKNKNTYTCTASTDVDEGNYIITPYEIVNGKARMIERTKDSHWIDRLPLYVVNDIWGYSLKRKAKVQAIGSLVKIYPNPVTETLFVDSVEKVNSLEVYSLMGEMLKKERNRTTINIQNLNKGMYVLKIFTDKGTSTYKFRKE